MLSSKCIFLYDINLRFVRLNYIVCCVHLTNIVVLVYLRPACTPSHKLTKTLALHTLGESDAKVLSLAEQIIAAMPEHIKNESANSDDMMMSLGSPISDGLGTGDGNICSGNVSISVLNDTFMEPLLDTSLPSSQLEQEFNFEFNDQNYRYHDVGTPCSSLSPASSGPLQSPASYSIAPDPPMGSPSPPPTTEDFTEFLQASSCMVNPFESAFSNLTLTGVLEEHNRVHLNNI